MLQPARPDEGQRRTTLKPARENAFVLLPPVPPRVSHQRRRSFLAPATEEVRDRQNADRVECHDRDRLPGACSDNLCLRPLCEVVAARMSHVGACSDLRKGCNG
jgi:hypothetical protein